MKMMNKLKNRITIREISDNNSSISSTRWAFSTVILFDIVIISFSIVAFIICHLAKKPLDNSFFYSVGTLLGILTALVTTSKSLQGFETKKHEDKISNEGKEEKEESEEINSDNSIK